VATPKANNPAEKMAGEWSRSSERRTTAASNRRSATTKRRDLTGLSTSHVLSLKGRALALLARREHSRAELRNKLGAHAESPEALERMLDLLADRGFLSDARVVESFIHQRAAKLGSTRIQRELDRKGIEPEVSASALATLRDSEGDRAWNLWLSKFGQRPGASEADRPSAGQDANDHTGDSPPRERQAAAQRNHQRERARQQRFLLSRGFSAAVVSATLRRAGQANGDGDTGDCFEE
jgi:regulatory protein